MAPSTLLTYKRTQKARAASFPFPEECARRRTDIPAQPLLNMCRIRSFAIDIGTATLNVFLIRALYLIADDRIGMQKTIPHLFEQEPSALWIG